ncbi:hypothetical protein MMPV_001153 [Pyropia vietnamensis]
MPSQSRGRTATYVTPGDRLGSSAKYTPTDGAYTRGDAIYAAIAGALAVTPTTVGVRRVPPPPPTTATPPGTTAAAVATIAIPPVGLPAPGAVVTCRVARLTGKSAALVVLASDGVPTAGDYRGLLRSVDVRTTDVDTVEMSDVCVPGDILVAGVVGVGDRGGVLVSLLGEDRGVVAAMCGEGDGGELVPVGWGEMVCPRCGRREKRKVARVPR